VILRYPEIALKAKDDTSILISEKQSHKVSGSIKSISRKHNLAVFG